MSFSVSAGKRKPNWFLRSQQLNSKPETESIPEPEPEPELEPISESPKEDILVTNLKLELQRTKEMNINYENRINDLISSNSGFNSSLQIKNKEIDDLRSELDMLRLENNSLRNVVPSDKSESDEEDENDVGGGLELHPRLASF